MEYGNVGESEQPVPTNLLSYRSMGAESLELMERQRKEKCSLIIFIGGEEDEGGTGEARVPANTDSEVNVPTVQSSCSRPHTDLKSAGYSHGLKLCSKSTLEETG